MGLFWNKWEKLYVRFLKLRQKLSTELIKKQEVLIKFNFDISEMSKYKKKQNCEQHNEKIIHPINLKVVRLKKVINFFEIYGGDHASRYNIHILYLNITII